MERVIHEPGACVCLGGALSGHARPPWQRSHEGAAHSRRPLCPAVAHVNHSMLSSLSPAGASAWWRFDDNAVSALTSGSRGSSDHGSALALQSATAKLPPVRDGHEGERDWAQELKRSTWLWQCRPESRAAAPLCLWAHRRSPTCCTPVPQEAVAESILSCTAYQLLYRREDAELPSVPLSGDAEAW